jgi:hypothetical protein
MSLLKRLFIKKFVPSDKRVFFCPFYGFQKCGNLLLDGEGNGCGLIEDRLTPCIYELQKKPNNWMRCCRFGTLETAHKFIKAGYKSSLKIFPHEIKEGKGLSFKQWLKYFERM